MGAHPFDRYADFIDVAALKEASEKPLRKCMRVNTLKCSVEEFITWAKAKGWSIAPVPWCAEGFFIDREDRTEALGKDLLHVLGYSYIQEASSMLPISLLDPKPGDRVLDMSSAPGSKSTQIAAKISPDGLLIANDIQEKRIWGMLSNLQRCGIIDTVVTKKVGQWFGGHMTEMFDKVLCDAPCTAQGTSRKDSDALKYASADNIGKMAKLQRELLESAVHACKVGGKIVYSTCTLTPEENELLVLSIVNKFSTQLKVIDPRTLQRNEVFDRAIEDSEKVQRWLKKEGHTVPFASPFIRLWPQTADTEGFFSAVLEKTAPTKAAERSERRDFHRFPVMPPARMKEIKDRLEDWYGAEFLRDEELLIESKEQMFVLPEKMLHIKFEMTPYVSGLPFAKPTNHGLPRLSHEMATLRGAEAARQVLVLDEQALRKAIRGENLVVDSQDCDDGDVLLSYDTNPLRRRIIIGRGLLKNGIVLNRLPREMVRLFA